MKYFKVMFRNKVTAFRGSLRIYPLSHEIMFFQHDSQLDQVPFLFLYRMESTFQGAGEDI